MPYILGLLILIFGGFVFRKTLIALLGVVLVLIALLGASFITFWASVLLLGRIDAIIASGSGWFEIPACVVTRRDICQAGAEAAKPASQFGFGEELGCPWTLIFCCGAKRSSNGGIDGSCRQ